MGGANETVGLTVWRAGGGIWGELCFFSSEVGMRRILRLFWDADGP